MARLQNKNLQNNLRRGGGQSIVPSNQGTNVAIPQETDLRNPFAVSTNLFKSTMAQIGKYIDTKAAKQEIEAEKEKKSALQGVSSWKKAVIEDCESIIREGGTLTEIQQGYYEAATSKTDEELLDLGITQVYPNAEKAFRRRLKVKNTKVVVDKLDAEGFDPKVFKELTPDEINIYAQEGGQLPERIINEDKNLTTDERIKRISKQDKFKRVEAESEMTDDEITIQKKQLADKKEAVTMTDTDKIKDEIIGLYNNKSIPKDVMEKAIGDLHGAVGVPVNNYFIKETLDNMDEDALNDFKRKVMPVKMTEFEEKIKLLDKKYQLEWDKAKNSATIKNKNQEFTQAFKILTSKLNYLIIAPELDEDTKNLMDEAYKEFWKKLGKKEEKEKEIPNFNSVTEALKAGLKSGTKITVKGSPGTIGPDKGE